MHGRIVSLTFASAHIHFLMYVYIHVNILYSCVYRTHKIVGIATVSRTEHRVAQTRELECTRRVLPQVIQRGLQVSEVAHDHQVQVKKYVREELHLKNSSDTWHGRVVCVCMCVL
jgi:hypothetical protein